MTLDDARDGPVNWPEEAMPRDDASTRARRDGHEEMESPWSPSAESLETGPR